MTRRVKPHTHENLNEGGKLDPDDALRGGLPSVGVTPGGGSSGSGGGITLPIAATDVTTAVDGYGTVEAALAALDSGSGNVYTVEPQNVQSKQYLMRDGTWRDPLTVGDGQLTAGTIATVTDDTKYNAWPNVVRLLDGRLIMAYVKADNHNQDNTGNVVAKIGTVDYDGAVTWTAEFTIADETVGAINVALGVTDTGRVVAAYNLYNTAVTPRAPVDAVRVKYSDDVVANGTGATWSSAYTVNSGYTYTVTSGTSHLIQRRDGTLMMAVYGQNTGDTFYTSSCMSSTDDGETWGSEVIIGDGEGDSRNYYEPSLTLLSDDRILCVIRTEDADDMYQSVSTDGGATWSAPSVAFGGYSPANAIQLSTGTLVATVRGNAAAKLEAFVATDLGSGSTPPTWVTEGILDNTSYTELEYACPIELAGPDGRLLVVYSVQPSAALTNADIKTVLVTEGQTTSPTLPATPSGELGGTWAATTVDATHSGSTHAATQAAAEATAAAALAAHVASGGSSTHEHVLNVVFSGDASTTVWELPAAPVSDTGIAVYVAGSRSVAWVLSGALLTTLTFDAAPASASNNIVIDIVAATA